MQKESSQIVVIGNIASRNTKPTLRSATPAAAPFWVSLRRSAASQLAGLHPLRISLYARAAGSRDTLAVLVSRQYLYNTYPLHMRLPSRAQHCQMSISCSVHTADIYSKYGLWPGHCQLAVPNSPCCWALRAVAAATMALAQRPPLELDPALKGAAEKFDSYVLSDTLCAPTQTIGLATPPLSAALAGEVVTGTAGAAPALRLDPVLRRLSYHCNRLCAAGDTPEDACGYFLAQGGLLHRCVATGAGGRVDAAPAGLPGWPAASGALATLLTIRNAPDDTEDPPLLLASDGKAQLWVCDDGGDPIGGAGIPLPLPAGCGAADGWDHWLLLDAVWSASKASTAGRVDCVLLGYRPAGACVDPGPPKCWSVLSVTVVLPSATSAPSLSAAALVTKAEPLGLRCGRTAGSVHCLLIMPQVWGGGGGGGAEPAPAAAGEGGVEDIGDQQQQDAEDGEEGDAADDG